MAEQRRQIAEEEKEVEQEMAEYRKHRAQLKQAIAGGGKLDEKYTKTVERQADAIESGVKAGLRMKKAAEKEEHLRLVI